MIEPTAGRIVHFHPSPALPEQGEIHAAIIARVWNDRMINLSVFDTNGVQYPMTSVTLVQPEDDIPPAGCYATWMPYQKGQAAKTEDLEAKLAKSAE